MTSLLALVCILALTAWLGSLVVQLEREISAARRRTRVAWEKEKKLHALIEQMAEEERTLEGQVANRNTVNAEYQEQVKTLQAEVAARDAAGRRRLLVLNPRRNQGDKEWLVTLTNSLVLKNDPNHPLASEWADGRVYLVFAKTDYDARERALRRFTSRPGMAVKTSAPAPAEFFISPPMTYSGT